jgi:hypothetical protein
VFDTRINVLLPAVAKNAGLSLPDMKAAVLKSTVPAVQFFSAAQVDKIPNLMLQIPNS